MLSKLVLLVVEGKEHVVFDATAVLLMTCFMCSINNFFLPLVDISSATRCFDEGSIGVAIRTASLIVMRYGETLWNKNFQQSDTLTFTHNGLCAVFNFCNDERYQAKMKLFRSIPVGSANGWRTFCSSQRVQCQCVILSYAVPTIAIWL